MKSKQHACRECGTSLSDPRKLFCNSAHRMAFNNRRMQRGAMIYDLFRALRRERTVASAMNLWSEICRLERVWNDEDNRDRPGRRSYTPPKEALANLADKGSVPRGPTMWTNI